MITKPALNLPGYVDGIDVSRVQTIDDAEAIARAGFRFAFVKVAEGLSYRDPRARSHLDALAGAGLHVGAYAFARVSQGHPREQARAAYDAATDDGRHVVRVVLDLESCPDGTPWPALHAFAAEWIAEMQTTGALPVLYTMGSWLQPLRAVELGVPIWVAQYRSVKEAWAPSHEEADAAFARWGPDVVLWQYSGDHGYRVPGIPEDCDRNLFRGDESALREWFGLPPAGE